MGGSRLSRQAWPQPSQKQYTLVVVWTVGRVSRDPHFGQILQPSMAGLLFKDLAISAVSTAMRPYPTMQPHIGGRHRDDLSHLM